jgi:hypothetical protein
MKQSIISTAVGTLTTLAAATLHPGQCPSEFTYNKSTAEFDPVPLSGLWYEYVWDQSVTDDIPYMCSMWTLLQAGDSNMVAYNSLFFGEDQESKFASMPLDWAAKTADGGQLPMLTYDRVAAHELGSSEKAMHMVFTDYYSYLVAKTCQNKSEDSYETGYFVMVRDKQPSMYMRNEVRNYLLKEGVDISAMIKGPLTTCWGKDIY